MNHPFHLRSARTLALAALTRLVADGPLPNRLADAYLNSLSKIITEADFPEAVIDILAEFDAVLGAENEELLIDRLQAMSVEDTEALSRIAITLLQELDAAVRLE